MGLAFNRTRILGDEIASLQFVKTLAGRSETPRADSAALTAGVGLLFFFYFAGVLLLNGYDGVAAGLFPIMPGLLLVLVGSLLQ